jgi:hypothetical protein
MRLNERWLRRGIHRSTKELVASIRSWITDWNENPAHSSGTRPPMRSSRHSSRMRADL